MAASQADSGIVAKAFGGTVRRCSKTPGPASYDDLGQRFVFCPAPDDRHWTYAIDVERRGIAVPDILELSLNAAGDEFYRRWTELEVLGKLYDIPVLALVKFPVVRDKVMLDRVDTKNHYIVVGKRDIREKVVYRMRRKAAQSSPVFLADVKIPKKSSIARYPRSGTNDEY